MHLAHLGLPVRDENRSQQSYSAIIERNDEADYTAFKCLDPDGHRIEVYWEPPRSR